MIQVLAVESLSSPLKSAGAPALHAIPDTHTRGARAFGCVLPCPAFVPSGGAPILANYRYGWQSNKITKGGGGEKKGRKEKSRKEKEEHTSEGAPNLRS